MPWGKLIFVQTQKELHRLVADSMSAEALGDEGKLHEFDFRGMLGNLPE